MLGLFLWFPQIFFGQVWSRCGSARMCSYGTLTQLVWLSWYFFFVLRDWWKMWLLSGLQSPQWSSTCPLVKHWCMSWEIIRAIMALTCQSMSPLCQPLSEFCNPLPPLAADIICEQPLTSGRRWKFFTEVAHLCLSLQYQVQLEYEHICLLCCWTASRGFGLLVLERHSS